MIARKKRKHQKFCISLPKQVTSNTHYNALEVMELSKHREPWGDMSGSVWGWGQTSPNTPESDSRVYSILQSIQPILPPERGNKFKWDKSFWCSGSFRTRSICETNCPDTVTSGMNIVMITFDWSCRLGSAVQCRRLKSGSLAAPSEAAELQLLRFFLLLLLFQTLVLTLVPGHPSSTVLP